MAKIKIAAPSPFCGEPIITVPAVFGASPGKELILKISCLGKRPISFSVDSLPKGLSLIDGVIRGSVSNEGSYAVVLTAENEIGKCEKKLTLEISPDHLVLTPLLGFTTWNAYRNSISQQLVESVADDMQRLGISEYGYSYINVDSTWQDKIVKGGLIAPNERFPDMKGMCERLHAMGYKCGIYSTPMLRAFGDDDLVLPGCTTGDMDMRYRTVFYGVGLEHHEGVNARQWAEWGFDYLKYDWTPCDVENADLMKRELLSTDRDFAFCVTVKAELRDVEYWRKNCTSWRNNTDSADTWEVFKDICFGYDHMLPYAKKGHYFDLDMLEVGYMFDHRCALSESEQMMAFTVRAIFPSPIQLSLDFSKLTDFEYALICNEEVIAVNQDELCLGAVCLSEEKSCSPDGKLQKHIKIYSKTLADGTSAVAVFNIGSTSERISIPAAYARDLWQKRDEIVADGEISIHTEPHTVRLFKIKA